MTFSANTRELFQTVNDASPSDIQDFEDTLSDMDKAVFQVFTGICCVLFEDIQFTKRSQKGGFWSFKRKEGD